MFGKRKTTNPAPEVTVTPALVDEDATPAGVFLGSLRSEVDEPEAVPEPFERLAVVAEGIIGAYRRRALSAEQAAERLQLLRLDGTDNIEWTLGATSMRWYRRLPGGTWKVGVPPVRADAHLSLAADRAVEKVAALGMPAGAARPASFAAPAEERSDAYEPFSDMNASATELPVPPEPTPDTEDTGGDHGYGVAAVTTRPTLSTLPSEAAGGYGYGEDDTAGEYGVPAPAPANVWLVPAAASPDEDVTDGPEPLPTDDDATASVPDVTSQGDGATSVPQATVEEDPETAAQAEELRSMLAALSQDTGINLTGFDRTHE